MRLKKIRFTPVFAAISLIFITCFSHARLRSAYEPRFPHFQELMILGDKASLQDILFIVGGFRSVAADMAWIQLLQYVGGASVLDFVDTKTGYPLLKSLTLRVMKIDPYFVKATSFGAGLLAWLRVINRPNEAVELLEKGIEYNPNYWPFHSYLIGIGYQKSDQIDKMVEAMGDTIQSPDCPVLVKIILANTFKANKKYEDALKIWEGILLTSNDPAAISRASQQIAEISKIAEIPSRSSLR